LPGISRRLEIAFAWQCTLLRLSTDAYANVRSAASIAIGTMNILARGLEKL